MSRFKDLTGQKFGKLTVKNKIDKPSHLKADKTYWLCICDCGEDIIIETYGLTSGRTTHCGCSRSNIKNLSNERFGRLVVLSKTNKRDKNNGVVWLCKCDCGECCEVAAGHLTSGNTQSCGCFHKERTIEVNTNNLLGKRFGRLIVIGKTSKRTKFENIIWNCLCDCGSQCEVSCRSLLQGHTMSCGCLQKEIGRLTINDKLIFIDDTCVTNIQSKTIRKDNSTGVKGVTYGYNKRYVARITFKKQKYYLGSYDKLSDAKKMRKLAEENMHDAFVEWYYNTFPEKKRKSKSV